MSDWHHGVKVPSMSIDDLRGYAREIRRKTIRLGALDRFPALVFAEIIMPSMRENYDFEVVDSLPDGNEARAFPDGAPPLSEGPLIQVLSSVYDKAAAGQGRARMTVLHECGHVLLHANLTPQHGRGGRDLKAFENSEWQANQFAGELLMPVESMYTPGSLDDYVVRMGVSRQAACNRAIQLMRTIGLERPDWPLQFATSTFNGGAPMQKT